jgi:hypothetical protein
MIWLLNLIGTVQLYFLVKGSNYGKIIPPVKTLIISILFLFLCYQYREIL